MLGLNVGQLEVGNPHLDPNGFGFVAPRNDAAVVVAQNYDRAATERRVETPLAAYVEIIRVNESDHD